MESVIFRFMIPASQPLAGSCARRRKGVPPLASALPGVLLAGCVSSAAPGWDLAFSDDGRGDWSGRWFLEGDLAVVERTGRGLELASGPTPEDPGSHTVLWTRQSFSGDLRIEFDFTRLDTMTEATSVIVIYLLATGTGTDDSPRDIALSSSRRGVPWMRSYFLDMNLLHISYAATGPARSHYVAARRYPAASVEDFDQSTLIPPVYEGVMLFEPGDTYHITVIKEGDRLSFTAETEGQGRTFSWDTSTHAPVLEGRVGFRQMGARRSRYENISIHVREPAP